MKYFTMKYKYYQIMTTPRHHINKSLHVLMLSLMLYQICSNFSKESKHRYPYMQMLLMIYIYESYKSLLSLTLPFLLFLKSAMLSKTKSQTRLNKERKSMTVNHINSGLRIVRILFDDLHLKYITS